MARYYHGWCFLWSEEMNHLLPSVTAKDHIHRFRLTSLADLRDKNLRAFLREAYAVGCQEHLYRK